MNPKASVLFFGGRFIEFITNKVVKLEYIFLDVYNLLSAVPPENTQTLSSDSALLADH